ncbi:MAG: tetratricopeptide repeat protein [Burkholderiales bacterium]
MPHFLLSSAKTLLAIYLASMAFAASANLGESDSSGTEEANFVEGKKAVEAQDWGKAIEWLSKAVQAQPQSADAHNFLGYAYRKNGKYDASFQHYQEALKLNPKHKHAHEYIGEAYLLTNNLFKAEYHLAELEKICTPIPCEEYRELKRAVETYKKSQK